MGDKDCWPRDKKDKGWRIEINTANISIIVQGEVSTSTPRILKTFKSIFPLSEIILSTWEGNNTEACVADKILFNKDPGAFVQNKSAKGMVYYNNVNRQIISTSAGLRCATRKYSLKTRTDIFINNSSFFEYWDKYDEQSPPTMFENRLLICDFYSRNPRIYPTLFHPSDWLFFGKTSDIKKYFDVPLMTKEDALWFDSHKRKNNCFRDNLCRYFPEQWLCLNFIRKSLDVNCECFYDATKENIEITERFIAENMVILDSQRWGLTFMKYNPNRYGDNNSLLHEEDWKILYEHYCLQESGGLWLKYKIKNILYHIYYVKMRGLAASMLGRLGVKRWIQRKLTEVTWK